MLRVTAADVFSLLSLARPGHPATPRRRLRHPIRKAVLLRRGETLLTPRQSPPHFLHVRHLLVLHLDQRARRPTPPFPHRLLVRARVEPNEQHQITRQNAHPGERRELLTGTNARRRQPRVVFGGEVGVGGEVDEAQVDDELDDLQHGDVFFPPDADAAGGLEVVPVHDDVDGEVEADDDPGDGGVADELGVAEEGGGAVVVGVEEGERFLLEEEEDGVDELEVFCEVVELESGFCQWLVV